MIVNLAFGLSDLVHSSSCVLCLTRCFLRLDALPFPALHFALQTWERTLSVPSSESVSSPESVFGSSHCHCLVCVLAGVTSRQE